MGSWIQTEKKITITISTPLSYHRGSVQERQTPAHMETHKSGRVGGRQLSRQEAKRTAQNRTRWRALVDDLLYVPSGTKRIESVSVLDPFKLKREVKDANITYPSPIAFGSHFEHCSIASKVWGRIHLSFKSVKLSAFYSWPLKMIRKYFKISWVVLSISWLDKGTLVHKY